MFDYYDPNNTDFLVENEKIKRARALSEALRGQVKAPEPVGAEGFTSAVTGTRVLGQTPKASKFAMSAPLLAHGLNALAQHGYDLQQAGLNKSEQEAVNKWLASKPQATMQTTNPGAILEGADPVREMVEPTDDARMNWAQGGLRLPSQRDTAQAAIKDIIVNEPVRADARAEKAQARADKARENHLTRLNQLQLQQQRNDARLEQIKLQGTLYPPGSQEANRLRAEALRLTQEQRAIDNERKERELAIRQQEADAKTTKAEGGGGTKMTAQERKDMVKSAGTVAGLNTVLSNLTESMFNPLLHSELTQFAGARSSNPQDQKDSATWSQYRDIANKIRNELYGSALTKHEQAAFDSTSIDTKTGLAQAKTRVARMYAVAKNGLARQNALIQHPGAVIDPDSGDLLMPDGNIVPVPGIVSIELNGMAQPTGSARASVLPKSNPAAKAPTPAAAPASAPSATRVAPEEQKARDDEAQGVLLAELKKAGSPGGQVTNQADYDAVAADLRRKGYKGPIPPSPFGKPASSSQSVEDRLKKYK